MIKVTGFSPGIDPTTQGVIVNCQNMLPTIKGLKSEGAGDLVFTDALIDNCVGAETVAKIDDSFRTFAGTSNALYEVISSAWVDVSKAGGYATPAIGRWRFAQFGDATIATNYTDPVQLSTGSGAFTDLGGTPPKAKIVISNNDFVLLFDYDDGVNVFNDGWWASGLLNHTTWTPSASTQAANGRLLKTQGSIIGAKPLGNSVIAYKKNSMYIGQYVGLPVIWAWDVVASDVGAYSHESIVQVFDSHYFMGRNGIFAFDGSRPVPIGSVEVRDWLLENINADFTDSIIGGYDPKRSLVFWFYASNLSSGELDESIVYNTITGQFGRFTRKIRSLLNYYSPKLTWAEYGAIAANWLSLGDETKQWLSPVLNGSGVGFSFIGDDNKLYKTGGVPTTSSIETGDIGDDTYYHTVSGVRVRFINKPDGALLTHYKKTSEGDALIPGQSATMRDTKFDILTSSRFHRFVIRFVGDCEVSAIDTKLIKDGDR